MAQLFKAATLNICYLNIAIRKKNCKTFLISGRLCWDLCTSWSKSNCNNDLSWSISAIQSEHWEWYLHWAAPSSGFFIPYLSISITHNFSFRSIFNDKCTAWVLKISLLGRDYFRSRASTYGTSRCLTSRSITPPTHLWSWGNLLIIEQRII